MLLLGAGITWNRVSISQLRSELIAEKTKLQMAEARATELQEQISELKRSPVK